MVQGERRLVFGENTKKKVDATEQSCHSSLATTAVKSTLRCIRRELSLVQVSAVRRAVAKFEAAESLFGYQYFAACVAVPGGSQTPFTPILRLCVLLLLRWGRGGGGAKIFEA